MNFQMKLLRHAMVFFMSVAFLSGCATTSEPTKKVAGQSDNIWHHYSQGMEALEKNDGDAALRKFDHALKLSGSFAPALAGKSLAVAMRAAKLSEDGYRKADIEKALALLEKAEEAVDADSKREQFIYHVTAIRVYGTAKPDDWLDRAQNHHQSAEDIEVNVAKLPYYQQREAADYFMAVAWYKEDFRETGRLLKSVLAKRSSGKWQRKASGLYKKVQKISLAAAHHTLSNVALKVAVLDEISRGDVAALLVAELKLDKLFAGRIPSRSEESKRKAEFIPMDIKEHPFRDEIATIMKWKVRGLAPEYDKTTQANLFMPNKPVDRKALALILEEVIIKLVPEQGEIATKHIDQQSAFRDVPSTVAWYNAIVTVTSRGLMASDLSGEFRPHDPVSGADLLLTVFKLRDVINIH